MTISLPANFHVESLPKPVDQKNGLADLLVQRDGLVFDVPDLLVLLGQLGDAGPGEGQDVLVRALAEPAHPCVIRLRPFVHFRSYEAPVNTPHAAPLRVERGADRLELLAWEALPPLRLLAHGGRGAFVADERVESAVVYRHERDREYE